MQSNSFSDVAGIFILAVNYTAFLVAAYAAYCYYAHWKPHFAFRKFTKQSISSGTLPVLVQEDSTTSSRVDKGASLNMDHLRVTYLQFLWGAFFIIPNMSLLTLKGISLLIIRRWLKKHGWDIVKKHVVEETVAELILETTLVTYFVSQNEESIGTFAWHYLPSMTNEDSIEIFKLFTVLIDLQARRFVKAEILTTNGETRGISAQDTLNLMTWNLMGNAHVKIHAMANWGCDTSVENDSLRQYAVSTVLYNYFGYSTFANFCAVLYSLGLTESPFKANQQAFDIGIDSGMHEHSNLHHLGLRSKLAYFVICARRRFLKLMREFRKDFNDAIPEAVFVGSIIHSLDHSQLGYVIQDDLWFEADDPYYAAIAGQCRIVRAAFVDDLPFLLWSCKCKDSHHPFFRKFYEDVVHIDARLAGYMDCCIIK